MPTNITDVEALTDPIQGPADADPQNAASYNVGFQGLANRTRWLINRLGTITGLGEWLYPTPKTRVLKLSPLLGDTSRGGASADPGWFVDEADPARGETMVATIGAARWSFDLNRHIPAGATITRIKALVIPAASYTGGNRMAQLLVTTTPVFGDTITSDYPAQTVTTIGQSTATSTVRHSIDSGVIAHLMNPAQLAFVRVQAGTAGVGDRFEGLEITFTDPGPRND